MVYSLQALIQVLVPFFVILLIFAFLYSISVKIREKSFIDCFKNDFEHIVKVISVLIVFVTLLEMMTERIEAYKPYLVLEAGTGGCKFEINEGENKSRQYAVFAVDYSDETVALVALLHDICKLNFYKIDYRNAKNAQGVWEKVPYYAIDDQFPYGHGEKSVFLIERKMRLKIEEAMAIRWHMGEFGDKNSNVISQAYDKYTLAVQLHLADLESTFLREKGLSQVK